MKLIYCPSCHDVLKLQEGNRTCWCGASWGSYHGNKVGATIGGRAVPLGITNQSFRDALSRRPTDGLGRTFTAFVIPEHCKHIMDGTITDGDTTWSVVCPQCGERTMQVVRPGKVQCSKCG